VASEMFGLDPGPVRRLYRLAHTQQRSSIIAIRAKPHPPDVEDPALHPPPSARQPYQSRNP
jgi:hypothetical protein